MARRQTRPPSPRRPRGRPVTGEDLLQPRPCGGCLMEKSHGVVHSTGEWAPPPPTGHPDRQRGHRESVHAPAPRRPRGDGERLPGSGLPDRAGPWPSSCSTARQRGGHAPVRARGRGPVLAAPPGHRLLRGPRRHSRTASPSSPWSGWRARTWPSGWPHAPEPLRDAAADAPRRRGAGAGARAGVIHRDLKPSNLFLRAGTPGT